MSVSAPTTAAPGPRVLRWLEGLLVALSVCAVLGICAIIFCNVVARSLFGWSIPDAEIVVRDLMIASIILPLAYVAAERAHIAVDIFVGMMPAGTRPWIDLLGSVVGLLVLLPIAYGGWKGVSTDWLDGNYYYGELEVPAWYGKAAFFAGYLVFVLRMASLVVIDLIAALRPRPAGPDAALEG